MSTDDFRDGPRHEGYGGEIFKALNDTQAQVARRDRVLQEKNLQTVNNINRILDHGSYDQVVDGQNYRISLLSTKVRNPMHDPDNPALSPKHFFARVYSLEDKRKSGISDFDNERVYGVFFDETADEEIVTPNPHLLRIVGGQAFMTRVNETGEIDAEVGEDHELLLESIVGELSKRVETGVSQKNRAKAERRWRRNRIIKRVAGWGGALALLGGVIGGGVYAIVNRPNEIRDFDKMGYVLSDEGQEIAVGQESHPKFSKELFDAPYLKSIPEWDTSGMDRPGDEDREVDLTDGLRKITIGATRECRTVEVRDGQVIPANYKIIAWTSSVDPVTRENRSQELRIRVDHDKIRACWDGVERSDEDNPDVVLQILRVY